MGTLPKGVDYDLLAPKAISRFLHQVGKENLEVIPITN